MASTFKEGFKGSFVEEADVVTFFNALPPKPAPITPEGAAAGFAGGAAAGFAGGAAAGFAGGAAVAESACVSDSAGIESGVAASNPSFLPTLTRFLEITVMKFVNIKVVINTTVIFLLKYVDMNPTDKNINMA
jgi:hypothetical protein